MSHPDQPADQPKTPDAPNGARPDPAAVGPSPAHPAPPASTRPAPRPRGGGSLALALLLSLLALGAAGYVAWQQWQLQRGNAADSQGVASLLQRVDSLETRLGGIGDQRASLDQRLDDAAAVNRSLREELLGQAERTRNLEDAVARLAEKTLSGHDAMLLDQTDSLLRMGAERYRLFHDARAAADAYGLADQTLAAVNGGAFSGVRQSIQAEREALLESEPVNQAGILRQLQDLRGALVDLPLKPLDSSVAGEATDAWSRIRRALGSVVSVQHDNGAPLAVSDARIARELAALDLAQAQAAVLAHDPGSYAAALKRVDASLASRFDGSVLAVQQARHTLKQLESQLPAGAPVQLGAALAELRNLRAVRALAPAPTSSVPRSRDDGARKGGAEP